MKYENSSSTQSLLKYVKWNSSLITNRLLEFSGSPCSSGRLCTLLIQNIRPHERTHANIGRSLPVQTTLKNKSHSALKRSERPHSSHQSVDASINDIRNGVDGDLYCHQSELCRIIKKRVMNGQWHFVWFLHGLGRRFLRSSGIGRSHKGGRRTFQPFRIAKRWQRRWN